MKLQQAEILCSQVLKEVISPNVSGRCRVAVRGIENEAGHRALQCLKALSSDKVGVTTARICYKALQCRALCLGKVVVTTARICYIINMDLAQ